LGASASTIPKGMPFRNASGRRATGYSAAAIRSVVWPRMSSETTGAKQRVATAIRKRSTGAWPCVSSVTPVTRIAMPMSIIAIAAMVGETHVSGRATRAAIGV